MFFKNLLSYLKFIINRVSLETYIWEKNASSLVQFSEADFFFKNSFLIQESMKIYKDMLFNRTIVEKLDELEFYKKQERIARHLADSL